MLACSSQSKASWVAENFGPLSTYQMASALAWRQWRNWCVLGSVYPLTCYPTGLEEDTGHGGMFLIGGAWMSMCTRSASGSGVEMAVHACTRSLLWHRANASATRDNTTSPTSSLDPRSRLQRKNKGQILRCKVQICLLSFLNFTSHFQEHWIIQWNLELVAGSVGVPWTSFCLFMTACVFTYSFSHMLCV